MNEISDPATLPKLVVFDVGGTTVQTSVDVARTFQSTFQQHGIPITQQQIAPYRGASKRDAIDQLLLTASNPRVDASTVY